MSARGERVRRVRALVLRYLLLLRRDPARVVDTFYWPLIDIAVWGLLTSFVAGRGARLPNAIGIFLGAAILWNLFFRCAQDVSVSFLDDVWSRSVVTIFASPLSFFEFALAIMLLGLVKLLLTLAAMGVAAGSCTRSASSRSGLPSCPSSPTSFCSAGRWGLSRLP